jgi:transcriptional regulator with XRE-family HTH domain
VGVVGKKRWTGTRLSTVRDKLGLTQTQLLEKMDELFGFSPNRTTLSHWENGHTDIPKVWFIYFEIMFGKDNEHIWNRKVDKVEVRAPRPEEAVKKGDRIHRDKGDPIIVDNKIPERQIPVTESQVQIVTPEGKKMGGEEPKPLSDGPSIEIK